MSEIFHIRYTGGTADAHDIPARELAASLEGLDRIVARFLWAIETGTTAKRLPSSNAVSLNVYAPKQGSVDFSMFAGVASAIMPFIGSFQEAVRNKLSEHLVSYTMLSWGGRKTEAENHLVRALDIIEAQQQNAAEDRKHEREARDADRQREREHIQEIIRLQNEFHKADARKVAKPIGSSCGAMEISGQGTSTEIDEATAEVIKATEDLVVSDVVEMTFEVDGIELSSKRLKVFDPERPNKRVFVHILDPEFDPLHPNDNPYELAVKERSTIRLLGKATRDTNGNLRCFHAIGAATS